MPQSAFADFNISSLSYAEFTQAVRENLKNFVQSCLRSNYDAIVPIESEGLAILQDSLHRATSSHRVPAILPSEELLRSDIHNVSKLPEKTLVLDVSAYSGNTIRTFRRRLQSKFGDSPNLDVAAYIVCEHSQLNLERDISHYGFVVSREKYEWARAAIDSYLQNNVPVRSGDPIAWEIEFSEKSRSRLVDALVEGMTVTRLPYQRGEWTRISINQIEAVDTDRLYFGRGQGKFDFLRKPTLRVQMHKEQNRLRVLPLAFIKVPTDTRINADELGNYFPDEHIEMFSANSKHTETFDSYQIYEIVNQLASTRLMIDFVNKLRSRKISMDVGSVKVISPHYSLAGYTGEKKYYETVVEYFKYHLHTQIEMETTELPLQFPVFDFKPRPKNVLKQIPDTHPPHIHLAMRSRIAHWARDVADTTTEDVDWNNHTLSWTDISSNLEAYEDYSISATLDSFVDEGILSPRLGITKVDGRNYLERKYVVGGEFTRNRTDVFADIEL